MMAGCGEKEDNLNMRINATPTTSYNISASYPVKVFKLDSCEYICYGGSIIHKGDCSNPVHHNDTLKPNK